MSVFTQITETPQDLLVCVLGLGYVGLPLAVAFAEHHRVIGLDTDNAKLRSLCSGVDPLGIHTAEQLAPIAFTSRGLGSRRPDIFVIAVPTDIDASKQPNLTPFKQAAEVAVTNVALGGIVIVESTVYPGATREILEPIAAQMGRVVGVDFFYGFSPERIVPGKPTAAAGDLHGAEHTLRNTIKIVSGCTPAAAAAIEALYARVITAGIHVAPTVEVAEAAKILENTQRDLNIALMNEFSMICDRLGIDTQAVIDAAATKWNFHPYRPGLVGGHCIGVDPYYLAYQAKRHGFHANVVLAGRQVNDRMGVYVARQTAKMLTRVGGNSVLILGATFKENCEDLRNSRVPEIIMELLDFGFHVEVCDPLVLPVAGQGHHGAAVTRGSVLEAGIFDAVIVAVNHSVFLEPAYTQFLARQAMEGKILVDVKGAYRNHKLAQSCTKGTYWHL